MINNNITKYSNNIIKPSKLQMNDAFEFLRNGLNNESDDIRKSCVNGLRTIVLKLDETQLNTLAHWLARLDINVYGYSTKYHQNWMNSIMKTMIFANHVQRYLK
ncbi:hypothetical protein RFI_38660 [Reticulomyxa filosa]|uniref:Uncharacterized protein n=1 Tax=Reticulomyxa filosa TaxID=46433 RepID=X6L9W9_RETFI|nr:hypothetical protein RFI_38660 [Reticulomyxa filosa]|eukprot:ETN98827.1 hypothetical protein RFI_38660 [Reticulomyxa filosa]